MPRISVTHMNIVGVRRMERFLIQWERRRKGMSFGIRLVVATNCQDHKHEFLILAIAPQEECKTCLET